MRTIAYSPRAQVRPMMFKIHLPLMVAFDEGTSPEEAHHDMAAALEHELRHFGEAVVLHPTEGDLRGGLDNE